MQRIHHRGVRLCWPERASRATLSSALSCAAALALGCAIDAEPERLGFTEELSAVPVTSDARVTPADFVGRWQGQARDLLRITADPSEASLFHFASGSSDVTIELRVDDNDAVKGTLLFGAAAAPPVTDPLASYPPGATLDDYVANPAALEGARYQLDESVLDAGVLRLFYRTADAYADWCARQPSLLSENDGPATYNCLGAHGVAQADDDKCYTYDDVFEFTADAALEVDCARAFACLGQCSCDPPPGLDANPHAIPRESSVPCGSSTTHLGELWLRRADGALIGVFAGDAAFVNPLGARTMLGQIRFERLLGF